MERLMFGWDFEVDAWSRFWRWNLIKSCVWNCDINSTLGSVVPLAMFLHYVGMVGKNIQWEEDLLENKWPLHLCATVDWNGFTREYVVTFKAILLEMFGYLPKLVISSFWILKGMLLRPVSLDSNVFYDFLTYLNFCLDFEVLSWRRSYE